MDNISIKSYIYSKPELKFMPFMIVYKTIMSLIEDGLVKREDFKAGESDV